MKRSPAEDLGDESCESWVTVLVLIITYLLILTLEQSRRKIKVENL